MDGVIGPAIGAAIALASVFFTAKLTYRNNSRLEEQKIIRQKKEELYLACEKHKNSISASDIKVLSYIMNADHEYDSKFDHNNVHPLNHIRMLVKLYLPELKDEMYDLDVKSEIYGASYSICVKPDELQMMDKEERIKFLIAFREDSKRVRVCLKKIQDKLIR
ncbi:hypothetical protein [Pantoea ananatis]